jgi:hypothetical protein
VELVENTTALLHRIVSVHPALLLPVASAIFL